jgi:type II secretory pathway component PulC
VDHSPVMRTSSHAVLTIGLFVLLGCGESGMKEAESPSTSKTSATKPGAPPVEAVKVTALRRAAVRETISQGLGVFLQNVAVEDWPVMREGRFVGFKLKALNPEWGVDLKPGDVIVKVNGMTIEHPEDADAALRSLEKAPGLRVEYERDGKPRTLELPIVD